MSDAIPSDPSANEDDIDLSALPNAELVAQMHDDLYDGLRDEIVEGTGFEVINIGINNPVENYLEAIEEHKPDILGMSALLTTTMPYMKVVIDALVEKGIRDELIVLVGGAPLNEEFGQAIGADAYCRDAAVAVATATALISEKRLQTHNEA